MQGFVYQDVAWALRGCLFPSISKVVNRGELRGTLRSSGQVDLSLSCSFYFRTREISLHCCGRRCLIDLVLPNSHAVPKETCACRDPLPHSSVFLSFTTSLASTISFTAMSVAKMKL